MFQDGWISKVAVMSIDEERTWQTVETDENNQLEEVIFKIQGILAKKDLPPVTEVSSKDNYTFLQQHVRITGIRGEAFKDTADLIMKVQLMFERHFPDSAWEKWIPNNTDGIMALDISNRYFETRKTHPQEQAEYEQGVDPKGILAAACLKRNLIHTKDNKVRFYTSKIDKNRERK
ncbi:uncharacterized protein ARMOST_10113 [Armillaria ostoyae]|uniref:Uncharacterized protein n=1 Tax=Armillaria ostoyae TaxID=47428 RepID=A0A284RDE0_ARMOS|nr:uncharacterized protein ARMOST_10113 [Armillaria ostoyae]